MSAYIETANEAVKLSTRMNIRDIRHYPLTSHLYITVTYCLHLK